MKFCSYKYQGKDSWGLLAQNQKITDLSSLAPTLCDFLKSPWWEKTTQLKALASSGSISTESVEFMACIPKPSSMRDGYAFRQHVEAARKNRGAPMIPEFDLFPVFYYTNHQAVIGPGPCRVRNAHLEKLDFELEAAIVIGKEGIDISAEKADEYIFGYTIMNDFSARALQMEEMKMSLGPAKGKDFATALGPWLITTDELIDKVIPSSKGNRYNLEMSAMVNGKNVSLGNTKDMTWTFAQILERISYGTKLYPGDVIGSGTVGTGCFMELNGSGITNQWLKDGDEVIIEIEKIGQLKNTIKHYEP